MCGALPCAGRDGAPPAVGNGALRLAIVNLGTDRGGGPLLSPTINMKNKETLLLIEGTAHVFTIDCVREKVAMKQKLNTATDQEYITFMVERMYLARRRPPRELCWIFHRHHLHGCHEN